MGSRRDLPAREPDPRTPRPHFSTRFFITLAFLAALCLGAVRPAAAAVRADVDRDGRIDVLRLERSTVTIALSGAAKRLILPSIDSLTKLAVSDVDGDGDLDIVGLSEHHGVLFWRNTGLGRFIAARPARSRLLLRDATPAVAPAHASSSAPENAFTDPDRNAISTAAVSLSEASPGVPANCTTEHTLWAAAVPSASRAPPVTPLI
jgi:hypothetical protein